MSGPPDAKKPRTDNDKEKNTVIPERVNLLVYDGKNENHYNVILIVENQKFHVSKEHLAKRCSYFDSLFFGNFKEKEKKEITIHEISADDFQLFLECLEGVLEIDDEVIGPVACLADKFGASLLANKCAKWLLSTSKLPVTSRFFIGYNFNMENVKVAAILELTHDELEEITTNRLYDQKTKDQLFSRSMAISKQLQQQLQKLQQQQEEDRKQLLQDRPREKWLQEKLHQIQTERLFEYSRQRQQMQQVRQQRQQRDEQQRQQQEEQQQQQQEQNIQ